MQRIDIKNDDKPYTLPNTNCVFVQDQKSHQPSVCSMSLAAILTSRQDSLSPA